MKNRTDMRNRLFAVAAAVLLSLAICAAAASEAAAASRLNYTVQMNQTGKGQLYFNYGKNMEFFISGKDTFNGNCLVSSGVSYRFSTFADRGVIARPSEGWYFDGFYDKAGRRISMETVNTDIVRITVKGIYFYDCLPSYDNPQFSRYTEKAYKEEMKSFLKALYGVRSYRVIDKAVLYRLPKKSAVYCPRFIEKTAPELPGKPALKKNLDAPPFYAAGCSGFTARYSSSGSKVVKVDKDTGLAQIKGPGSAVITIKVPETGTSLAATYKVKVTVNPDPVSRLSAGRTADRKYVSLKWQADSRYSGYEIQISNTRSFSKITAKKTVTSGKTSSTRISTAKSAVCNYARIRPYKRSGGQKLYADYTVCALK